MERKQTKTDRFDGLEAVAAAKLAGRCKCSAEDGRNCVFDSPDRCLIGMDGCPEGRVWVRKGEVEK